jgi:hypothetical protein
VALAGEWLILLPFVGTEVATACTVFMIAGSLAITVFCLFLCLILLILSSVTDVAAFAWHWLNGNRS